MRDPFFCPVCNDINIRRVVESATVSPEDQPERSARGLTGYVCFEGHIFFVRASDLDSWPEYAEFP